VSASPPLGRSGAGLGQLAFGVRKPRIVLSSVRQTGCQNAYEEDAAIAKVHR
jgi:hypothetical protein